MNPKTIAAARQLPEQLRVISNALYEGDASDVRSAVSEARQALRLIEAALDEAEEAFPSGITRGVGGARRGRPPGGGRKAQAGARAAEGGKRFKTGPFVLEQLRANPKGVRPKDIAVQLEAAGGKQQNPLANVNSTLSRLKKQGLAQSKGGVWTLRGGGSTSTSTPKRRGRPRKAATKKEEE